MKEVTDVKLLQTIMKVFKLRELGRERFSLSESIQPIFDIGEISGEYVNRQESIAISGITGYKFLTVPDDIALRVVYHLDWRETNSGLHKVSFISKEFAKHEGSYSGVGFKFYGLGAAGKIDGDAIDFNSPLYLLPGDAIGVQISAETMNDTISVNLDCKEFKRG